MKLGGRSGLPAKLGGGPSRQEQVYTATKRAVGEGGACEDETSIEALWRSSRAKGLAAGQSNEVRAALQAFPNLATDALPYYERLLGVIPGVDQAESARRAAVVPLWNKRIDATGANLLRELQAIDARFELITVPREQQFVTMGGRWFAPLESGLEPYFGSAGHSNVPNFSDSYVWKFFFDVGYSGVLLPPDATKLALAKQVLRDSIPSSHTFEVFTELSFTTGASVLGLAALGA